MKSIKKMTNAELAAFIQSHLRNKGIEVVLSGGACVSIYSNNKYVSLDLDFISTRFVKRSKIREAMREVGFSEEGRYFKHPNTKFFIEFPGGPLSVGDEPVKEVVENDLDTGTLRMISPTDCVKDRLAGYYYWDDLQCLEQAILVANSNEVNLEEVERWSKVEGKLESFSSIKKQLKEGIK
jgi:hypothetical protein